MLLYILLGLEIDSELSFNSHVEKLCTKLSQRIGILKKIRSSLLMRQRLLFLYNSQISARALIGQWAMGYIVPVNPWKSRVSSELLYKSNRPHFLWVYRGNNPLGMFGRTLEKFVNHLPAARDLQTF